MGDMGEVREGELVEVSERLRIGVGDRVESLHDGEECVVRKGKDGMLLVKRRSGKYWFEQSYSAAEIHKHFVKVTESPALRFLKLLGQKNRVRGTHETQAMWRRVFCLAVESGMRFEEGDFEVIRKRHYWPIDVYSEDVYGMMVEAGNVPAVKEMERYIGRKPWLVRERGKERRLYVGARFTWEGLPVKVTSIQRETVDLNRDGLIIRDSVEDKPGEILIACHQEHVQDERGFVRETKTRRVFKLTQADLAERTALTERLIELGGRLNELAPPREKTFAHYDDRDGMKALLCEACLMVRWGARDYDHQKLTVDIDALEKRCEGCGALFYTQPGRETLEEALRELESGGVGELESEGVGEVGRWGDGELPLREASLRVLRAVLALGAEMGYARRILYLTGGN